MVAPGKPDSGFTLIEMIVVLAILGLMLGLVISHGPVHSQRLDLDMAAQEIARSLRLARSRAIAQNRTVTWVATAGALPADVTMTQAGTEAGTEAGAIRFAADGSSSGGSITLRAGERQIVVASDWLTGRVVSSEVSLGAR